MQESQVVVRLRTKLDFPAEEVFAWHLNPGAIYRMIPPWEKVEVLSDVKSPEEVNSVLTLRSKMGPFSILWKIKHAQFQEGESFTDIQIKGPFKIWKHVHKVYPKDDATCEWEDEIHFASPLAFLHSWIERKIKKTLKWRHQRLRNELMMKRRYKTKSMRVLVSGTSGLVGQEVTTFLKSQGHEVVPLLRKGKSEKKEKGIYWNPKKGVFKKKDFEGFDAVIHLAGKNIAHLWTKKHKRAIFTSRCRDSWLLSQILLRVNSPPQVLICASAAGFYGDRGNDVLTEDSPKGKGFLADVCEKWEEATKGIEKRKTRGIHTRFGIILSSKGGMLGRILPLFRMGLGAVVGSGKQYVSWISLDDVVYGIYHAVITKDLEGPVNFTAPSPETNRSFSKKIAHFLHRPLFLRIPASFLKLTLGQMAEEMLLPSVRAVPDKLKGSGYEFVHPTLEDSLQWELGNRK